MEESEKRRERLRAMRMEAAQAEVCSNIDTFPVPNSLSNPLVENSAAQPIKEQQLASSRFGFYTDPMAAFSANKKSGQPDNQIRQDYFMPPGFGAYPMPPPSSFTPEPRNSGMTSSPAHQLQGSSSFDKRLNQAQGPSNNPATYWGPRGAWPLPMHRGTPEAWNGSQATTGHYISTTHGHRSPNEMVHPFPMIHQGSPESWNGPVGAGCNLPSSASGGGQYFSPGFGAVRSPSFGQGRPQWQTRSPSPGSGRGGSPGPTSRRGGGRWYGGSMNPGLGYSRGRGRGHHSRGLEADGRQGPECFYNKSMDENPWQQLEPHIWKSRNLERPGSSNSWLPKSISMKKPRVSEASRQSSSQPSLAEYLAASFSEAANDAPNS